MFDKNRYALPTNDWESFFLENFAKNKTATILDWIDEEEKESKNIFPDRLQRFAAFHQTPIQNIKVIILGQDPYHQKGQAHGLSFSVKKGVKIPPSLRNIYKELQDDIDFTIPEHGFLEKWSREGVLLLNSTLTVEEGRAGSHQKRGWEEFTDKVISHISDQSNPSVFLLWGSFAQKKENLINKNKHLVLKAAHPSPLSAYRGFFGCRHFSKANDFLSSKGRGEIDWSLPSCSDQFQII